MTPTERKLLEDARNFLAAPMFPQSDAEIIKLSDRRAALLARFDAALAGADDNGLLCEGAGFDDCVADAVHRDVSHDGELVLRCCGAPDCCLVADCENGAWHGEPLAAENAAGVANAK